MHGSMNIKWLGEFEFGQYRCSEEYALIMGVDKLLPYSRHSLPDVGELFTICVS